MSSRGARQQQQGQELLDESCRVAATNGRAVEAALEKNETVTSEARRKLSVVGGELMGEQAREKQRQQERTRLAPADGPKSECESESEQEEAARGNRRPGAEQPDGQGAGADQRAQQQVALGAPAEQPEPEPNNNNVELGELGKSSNNCAPGAKQKQLEESASGRKEPGGQTATSGARRRPSSSSSSSASSSASLDKDALGLAQVSSADELPAGGGLIGGEIGGEIGARWPGGERAEGAQCDECGHRERSQPDGRRGEPRAEQKQKQKGQSQSDKVRRPEGEAAEGDRAEARAASSPDGSMWRQASSERRPRSPGDKLAPADLRLRAGQPAEVGGQRAARGAGAAPASAPGAAAVAKVEGEVALEVEAKEGLRARDVAAPHDPSDKGQPATVSSAAPPETVSSAAQPLGRPAGGQTSQGSQGSSCVEHASNPAGQSKGTASVQANAGQPAQSEHQASPKPAALQVDEQREGREETNSQRPQSPTQAKQAQPSGRHKRQAEVSGRLTQIEQAPKSDNNNRPKAAREHAHEVDNQRRQVAPGELAHQPSQTSFQLSLKSGGGGGVVGGQNNQAGQANINSTCRNSSCTQSALSTANKGHTQLQLSKEAPPRDDEQEEEEEEENFYKRPRRLSYLQSLLLRRWPCLALTICIMSSLIFGMLLSAATIYLMHSLVDEQCLLVAANSQLGQLRQQAAQLHHTGPHQSPLIGLARPFEAAPGPPDLAASYVPLEPFGVSSLGSTSSSNSGESSSSSGHNNNDTQADGHKPAAHFQRLPTSLWPDHYQLFIWPHIDRFTFEGQVKVQFDCRLPTDNITMHAFDLQVEPSSVRVAHLGPASAAVHEAGAPDTHKVDAPTGPQPRPQTRLTSRHAPQQPEPLGPKVRRVFQEEQLQHLIIQLDGNLEAGQKYEVTMDFTGKLNDDLAGFYKIKYERPNSSEPT